LAKNVNEADAAEILRNAEIPEDAYVAVFTGAHGIANGLDALVDVARVLKKRGRDDIWFLLMGDGSEKQRLQQTVAKEALNRVRFLGPVPKRNLFALLKRADIGLMLLKNVPAFYRGTSPNKFFDYLSCSLPVLVNYPGWMAGMVSQEECGFAIEPDNAEKFADTLIAAADGDGTSEMGRNGHKLAKSKFDRNLLGRRFVDALKTLDKV